MNILQRPSPNFSSRGKTAITAIVIHWWGLPSKPTTFDGIVSYLRKPSAQVSAHYVVSDTKVAQLVQDSNSAWHARQANPFTIGIEVDPRTPGDTYKTVAELVKLLRKRHGNLPLKKHSDYVSTQCPGTINLNTIEKLTKGNNMLFKDSGSRKRIIISEVSGRNLSKSHKGEYDQAFVNAYGDLEFSVATQKVWSTKEAANNRTKREAALRYYAKKPQHDLAIKQRDALIAKVTALENKKPEVVVKEVEKIVEVIKTETVEVERDYTLRGLINWITSVVSGDK